MFTCLGLDQKNQTQTKELIETEIVPDIDELDALPQDPHYRNLDMTMTMISIITYIFDLVSY